MADNRLTGLDASFLHLEDDSAHMHVAAVLLFEGDPPEQHEVAEALEGRLHLVPRYRQKLAFVPLGQGRPVWVDDPHFNLDYHVRKTALPEPGQRGAAAQPGRPRLLPAARPRQAALGAVDRRGPVGDGGFAVLSKTHHALVDGVSGVDIASVLFDTQPEPAAPPDPGSRWLAAPPPSRTQLLGDALVERMSQPTEIVRGVRAALRAPAAAGAVGLRVAGRRRRDGVDRPEPGAADDRTTQPIGPHRRFNWVRVVARPTSRRSRTSSAARSTT